NAIVNEVVSAAVSQESMIFLPTGDGLCIALIDPALPYDIHVRIALGIIGKIEEHNVNASDETRKFQIRMGLSENFDNLITDINANQNVAGAGINTAQRVMDTADAGQLLVSATVYELLRHREKYQRWFRPYTATVKHGVKLPVYQLVADGRQPGLN